MSSHENLLKGSLLMVVAFFFVALFGAFLKEATETASSLWVLFISYIVAGTIQWASIHKEGISFLKTQKLKWHLLRVGFGILATLLYALSIQYIPLLNASLLFNTAPLFMPILALLILKAKVPVKIWIAVILGFIGVIFILKPDISIFKGAGNLVGLASGLSQAFAFISLKNLTGTEPIRRINFYFFSFGIILLAPFAFIFGGPFPPLQSLGWALGIGILSFSFQLFIVKAYHYADPSHVGPFQYVSVVFSGILGWIFWNQKPTLLELIGVGFVMLGGILVISLYRELKQRDSG